MTYSKYKKSDFYYELPEELIARYPLENRSSSRLLVANSVNNLIDCHTADFAKFLNKGDLLIMNNTKVIPARMFGEKESGGKIEVLVERLLSPRLVKAYLRASKSPKAGSFIFLNGEKIKVLEKSEVGVFSLESLNCDFAEIMEKIGEMPIPPYLERRAEELDKNRYQTVYAKERGAVAAPTAGLHFDENLLNEIRAKGVEIAEITLHIGAGTFQPVREEDLSKHLMHKEWFMVSAKVVEAVKNCKKRGGRVIAIGTTSLRAIESAAKSGELKEFVGDTDLFITPSYKFKVIDSLFTNFHLPESTLIMLVSAFFGFDETKKLYQHAINERYRFFSYGDAVFLPNRKEEK